MLSPPVLLLWAWIRWDRTKEDPESKGWRRELAFASLVAVTVLAQPMSSFSSAPVPDRISFHGFTSGWFGRESISMAA
jgi:hypothetical protein